MTPEQLTAKYGPVVGQFNSKSKPETLYEVRCKDGAHTCQCPAWRFRRTCRHVDYAKAHPLKWADGTPYEKAFATTSPLPVTTFMPAKELEYANEMVLVGELLAAMPARASRLVQIAHKRRMCRVLRDNAALIGPVKEQPPVQLALPMEGVRLVTFED